MGQRCVSSLNPGCGTGHGAAPSFATTVHDDWHGFLVAHRGSGRARSDVTGSRYRRGDAGVER